MKNIFKTSFFALLLVLLGACTNDTEPVATANGGLKLLAPSSGSSFVLSPANASAVVTTLVWDYADNSVQSASTYTVEIAKTGTNFASIISGGTTSNRFLAYTVEQLNGFLAPNVFTPYVQASIDVRIKSTLGTNANAITQYSNVITLKVTPYSTALPKIGVPGNHQGWAPTNASTLPLMASSGYGKTNYEGYMNLNGEFKFLSPKPDGTFDWGTTDWGDDGSFSGILKEVNESNCNTTAGYYLVKANTAATGAGALQYSVTPITTWGVIGDATPGGWNSSSALTYNSTTKKWSATVALVGGKQLKFRANNSWDINLGKFDAGQTGDNFAGENLTYNAASNLDGPATSGNYLITLDLSNPRDYKYTITLQ